MTFVNMLVIVMSFDVEGMSETACSAEHLFILLSEGVNPVELACLAGLRRLQPEDPRRHDFHKFPLAHCMHECK